MKKTPQITNWLVTTYDKKDNVKEAFIVKGRTEGEAERESLGYGSFLECADWTMVKVEDEIKRFVKEHGMSQTAVKRLEGFKGGTDAVSEMAINFGYVWIEKSKKWINKNNSNFDERDEVVLNYIRENQ